jgi:hypothetical protein
MREMVQNVYMNTLLLTVAAEIGFVRTLHWTTDHGDVGFS